MRLALPGWNKPVQINSIYIERNQDKEGELGVVTECGCYLVLRNEVGGFSREPLFVPKVAHLGECQFLTQRKLEGETS